jgi:GTP pyrophosphokinase
MDWEKYKKQLGNSYKQKELDLIEVAFEFAKEAHKEQKRQTGGPYIDHPIAVSLKVANLKLDPHAVMAALLHDITEECKVEIKAIKKEFGPEVARLVKGVTKVSKIQYKGVERSAESMRKMFMAMAQDVRVIIIKLLDRLDNLGTLHVFSKEKQKRIALESLEIYAPVADRLGMSEIKLQLEDAAFKYAYPEEYEWIIKETKEKMPEREKYLKKVIPVLEKEVKKERIKILAIHYRAKHHYSLWKKLIRYGMDWYLIYDLMAVRIVVRSIEDCYTVLGIIHKSWKPLPGRIKDYIALPKQNGYKSLHTTVFGPKKKVIELQIRTPEMHEEAEFGIAAHWAWEMAGKPAQMGKISHRKYYWIKQLQDWQKKINKDTTGKEFLESLKIDFFKDRIFVLTPKGDVVDLPESATPIDFAYHVHSDIGNAMVAAKVNNRIVPLSRELVSGDIVEIMTQKNKKPSIKWLEHAKTSAAKNHIKASLKSQGIIVDLRSKMKKVIKTEIIIINIDRVGMIKDVTSVFSKLKINIPSLVSKELDNRYSTITLQFSSKNKEQVAKIVTVLKKIKGIEEVKTRTIN